MSFIYAGRLSRTLKYWNKKLINKKKERITFLFLKVVEYFCFDNKVEICSSSNIQPIRKTTIRNQVSRSPKIAMVVPLYISTSFELKCLNDLISSIQNQILKPDFIFFIDDNSVHSIIAPEEFTIIKLSKNNGPANARNIGLKYALLAKADIIAFTDLDCNPRFDWILQIKNSFLEHPEYSVFSGQTIAIDHSVFGRYHNINGTLNGRKLRSKDFLLYGTTANLAIENKTGMDVKFNEQFKTSAGEDIDFCLNASNAGYKIRYNKEMVVYHNYGYSNNFINNLIRFVRQFRKYSKSQKLLLQLNPDYYSLYKDSEEIDCNIENRM